MRLLTALATVAISLGCGAVQATARIADAEAALERARAAGAQRTAAYEYASAELYLGKAREKAGRAEHELAADLARRSSELSDAAARKAADTTPPGAR